MSILKFIVLGVIGVYLLVALGMYLFQERIIFLPEKLSPNHRFSFDSQFEEHDIVIDRETRLNLLHFKSDEPKGVILYFHGNAGNLDRWGKIVEPYIAYGYDVIIMDYRGYGKSTGKRSKQAMLDDVNLVYDFALNTFNENEIILFGRSIGSAFASHLAGVRKPKRLILETPFLSVADVAREITSIYPVSWLLKFNFKNDVSLSTATCPIDIFHGTEDEVVPYESGASLYQSLEVKEKEFHTIKGGRHNDLPRFDSYWQIISEILDEE